MTGVKKVFFSAKSAFEDAFENGYIPHDPFLASLDLSGFHHLLKYPSIPCRYFT